MPYPLFPKFRPLRDRLFEIPKSAYGYSTRLLNRRPRHGVHGTRHHHGHSAAFISSLPFVSSFPWVSTTISGDTLISPGTDIMTLLQPLQLFGFERAADTELANVQPITSFAEINVAWPVVVHKHAARRFREEAERRGEKPLPVAFLYVPDEEEGRRDASEPFMMHLSGPLDQRLIEEVNTLFPVLRAVQAIPESFFQQLDTPIPEMERKTLPIPPAVRDCLSESMLAREVFYRAMERRRARHRLKVSPSVDELVAFLDGNLSAERAKKIKDYLDHSPATRAEVDMLRWYRGSKEAGSRAN